MENIVNVIYVGGPTIIIEIGGLRLMTDPTLDPQGESFMVGDRPGYWKTTGPAIKNPGHIDGILLSHDQHRDNLDNAGLAFLKTVARTLTTPAGAARLGGNSIGLEPFASYTFNDKVTVTGTPARHGPAGTEHITGDVTGFVIQSGDVVLYLTGDTVYYEGIRKVAERFNPQFVFVFAGAARPRGPVNLTMSSNDVLDTADAFPHATIIPLHFEGWSHYSETPEDLTNAFSLVGIRHKLKILVPGVSTTLGEL